MVADTDILILPIHFPNPTAGLIKTDGKTFNYKFKRDQPRTRAALGPPPSLRRGIQRRRENPRRPCEERSDEATSSEGYREFRSLYFARLLARGWIASLRSQ